MSIARIVGNAAENDWSGVLLGQGNVLLVQGSSLNYIGSNNSWGCSFAAYDGTYALRAFCSEEPANYASNALDQPHM